MFKNYTGWNNKKQKLNNHGKRRAAYCEGDIHWCYFGENIGFEEDGKPPIYSRPGLILKGFSNELVLCVPFTSTIKDQDYYYPLKTKEVGNVLILSQARPIDVLRLGDKIGHINKNTLLDIKRAFAKMILE